MIGNVIIGPIFFFFDIEVIESYFVLEIFLVEFFKNFM